MKTLVSAIIVLFISLAFVGCQDAAITTTDKLTSDRALVPFTGTFEGVAVTVTPNVCQQYPATKKMTGGGTSAHLGLYEAEVNYCVSYNGYPPSGGGMHNGSVTMIAANGDQLYLTNVAGAWYFTSLTDIMFYFDGDISGGTGRFVNADGEFHGTGAQIFDPYNDPTPSSFTWTGSMTY